MNIYLHIEVSVRELDSKILLAVLAASKGHQVVLSDGQGLMSGFRSGLFEPGIYHTKSLTPSSLKISRHKELISKGFKVTSIDEENTLYLDGAEQFIKSRNSDITIDQSSAVFTWGAEETEILKKLYSKNLHKIHTTGSPRIDLWKSFFFDYWNQPKGMPKKPFLLVASNMIATDNIPFHDNIKLSRSYGYFQRDPEFFKNRFYAISEDYKKIYEFISAIEYLAKNNNGYDIVFRPHPAENIEQWKIFLEGVPNLHIIREDSITAWVKNAFAVMHNGCTTGVEAIVSDKPLLTFNPFQMEYDNKLFNTLGYNLKSKEELLIKANELFNSKKVGNKERLEVKLPEHISRKLYIDDSELAAEKMVKIWESLSDNTLSKSNNWLKFYLYLKIINFKKVPLKIISKLFPKVFKLKGDNHKFPPLEESDIQARVNRLQILLGIKKKLKCKMLSDRTVLIKN